VLWRLAPILLTLWPAATYEEGICSHTWNTGCIHWVPSGGAPKWVLCGGSLPEEGKTLDQSNEPVLQPASQDSVDLPWFALQVRARHEAGVAQFLESKGYTWFLPSYKCRKRLCDRVKIADAPLFPGYLFCRFDPQKRLPVLTTPGVLQVVGYNRVPVPIDESEISALQMLVQSGLPNQPWPFVRIGDRVQIEAGPLRGVEGILVAVKAGYRLILSVSLLQRSVAVQIDSAFVRSLGSAEAADLNRTAAAGYRLQFATS
jgi:transcription antitermination factor NusG